MPQKITPALTVRAAPFAPSSAQAAPTVRLEVPRGAACCHAFCFGCVIRHGSSCVLHPASFNRPPLHCITFHSLTTHHSLRLGYKQNPHSAQITTNSTRSLPASLISLHSVSFRPHSLSRLQSTRCPCCARLRCRSGCGPASGQLHFIKIHKMIKPVYLPKLQRRQALVRAATAQPRRTFRGLLIVRIALLRAGSLLTPFLLLAVSLREALRSP